MNAQQEIARKNAEQIREHERRFGKLGQLQTKAQKRALSQALAESSVDTTACEQAGRHLYEGTDHTADYCKPELAEAARKR